MCLLLNTFTLVTKFRHRNLGKQILTRATHMFSMPPIIRLLGRHSNEWDKVHILTRRGRQVSRMKGMKWEQPWTMDKVLLAVVRQMQRVGILDVFLEATMLLPGFPG